MLNQFPFVTLGSPLQWACITSEDMNSHFNLWLECWHRSIHTVIQSWLFALYKCIAAHSLAIVQKVIYDLQYNYFEDSNLTDYNNIS